MTGMFEHESDHFNYEGLCGLMKIEYEIFSPNNGKILSIYDVQADRHRTLKEFPYREQQSILKFFDQLVSEAEFSDELDALEEYKKWRDRNL